MAQQESARFGVSINVMGDQEFAKVQVMLFDEEDEGSGKPMLAETFFVTMDGQRYTREEWTKDILIQLIEKL